MFCAGTHRVDVTFKILRTWSTAVTACLKTTMSLQRKRWTSGSVVLTVLLSNLRLISRISFANIGISRQIRNWTLVFSILQAVWLQWNSFTSVSGFPLPSIYQFVEWGLIGVLLFVLRKRPIRDRAAAITHLRRNIRAEFKDIRLNSVVCKALWTIVRELENAPSTTNFRSNGENGKGKKRKHAEEEDEYRPSPISTLGKAAKTRSGKQTKKG